MIYKDSKDRGDTLVEVLLALALLSAVLFISWGVVNRATQIGTAARQRITMVDQLKEQAEIIQLQRDNDPNTFSSKVTTWATATTDPETNISPDACNNINLTTPGSTPNFFHFVTNSSGVARTAGSKLAARADAGRVWVQYVRNTTDGYIDFYIRGCWRTSGGQQRTDNTQFILRLNT